jgi:hypothetical protein
VPDRHAKLSVATVSDLADVTAGLAIRLPGCEDLPEVAEEDLLPLYPRHISGIPIASQSLVLSILLSKLTICSSAMAAGFCNSGS